MQEQELRDAETQADLFRCSTRANSCASETMCDCLLRACTIFCTRISGYVELVPNLPRCYRENSTPPRRRSDKTGEECRTLCHICSPRVWEPHWPSPAPGGCCPAAGRIVVVFSSLSPASRFTALPPPSPSPAPAVPPPPSPLSSALFGDAAPRLGRARRGTDRRVRRCLRRRRRRRLRRRRATACLATCVDHRPLLDTCAVGRRRPDGAASHTNQSARCIEKEHLKHTV